MDFTPQSMGRGKRQVTQTNRLTYPALGLPANSNEMAAGAASTSQQQVTQPRRAASVYTTRTSTSTQIMRNQLETKQRIAELEEEIETVQQQANELQAKKKKVERKLEALNKDEEVERRELIDAVIDMDEEIEVNQSKLDSLKRSFDRRKNLIELEEQNANAHLEDERVADETRHSEGSLEDPEQRISDWVAESAGGVDPNAQHLGNSGAPVDNPARNDSPPQSRTNYNLHLPVHVPPPSLSNYGLPALYNSQHATTHGQAPPPNHHPAFAHQPTQHGHSAPNQQSQFQHRGTGHRGTVQPPPGLQHPQQIFYPIYPQQQGTDMTLLASAIQNLAVSTSKKEKDLPSFNGNPSDWSLFESEYQRTTAKLPLTEANSINLSRIRKSLKGEAEKTVHHLLSKPENVPAIMETLRRRFGQAEHVLDALAGEAKSTPSPQRSKPDTVVNFGLAVQNLVTNIKSYNQFQYLQSVDLLNALVLKLPSDMKIDWYKFLKADSQRSKNLHYFNEWMTEELDIAYMHPQPAFKEEDKPAPRRNRHAGVALNKDGDDGKGKKPEWCASCKIDGHHLRDCRKFAKFPDAEKIKFVRDKRLCYSCFRPGHRTDDCKSKKPCSISGCTRHHHPTIHNADSEESLKKAPKSEPSSSPESPPNRPVAIGHVNRRQAETLLWYVPVKIRGPNGIQSCHAMIDSGCQVSLLDEGLATKLGIKGDRDKLDLGWFNGEGVSEQSMHVNLEVAGDYNNAKYHPMKNVRTVESLSLPAQSFSVEDITRKYAYLSGAPLRSLNNAKPSIVIGGDNWTLCLAYQWIMRGPQMPGAVKTAFGWTLVGPGGRECLGRKQANVICGSISAVDKELTALIKDFVIDENFGTDCVAVTSRSKEDERALEVLKKTTTWTGVRYSTGLLFKNEPVIMPPSKDMALRRLYLQEKKADKNSEFAQLYTSTFDKYINQGFLEKVMIDPREDNSKRRYIPHFFNLNPSKKPRLVFDAAAKCDGKSFNDFLLTGPDLLQPLAAVLMRFRRHNVGLTGDITAMFHQVALRPEDQPAQTILYRGMDRSSPPAAYQMTVLFFGSACSPCSAIYAKNEHARKFIDEYPAAVRATIEETYMDDLESGGKTEEETIQLYRDVTKIHQSGGFPIAKWSSSSVNVINTIPEELRANGKKQITSKSDLATEKTLGIFWDQAEDKFRFKLDLAKLPQEVLDGKRHPTKRELASFIMSLFDPLGFLTPLKIKGLIIFQQCWKLQIEWDSEVTNAINEKLTAWIDELHQINNIGVPRCYCYDLHKGKTQLHIFCDASEEAFSAVAYLRVDMGGSIKTAFVTSKAKVARLKGLTIPRMELNAALMGARMARSILSTLIKEVQIISTHFWTDSRTVFCWINSEHGRFSQYVSNRVSEILDKPFNAEQWRWVPTLENVADEATRSTKPTRLSSDCRWFQGPGFLFQDESKWPVMKTIPTAEEKDLEKLNVIMTAETTLPMRFPLPKVKDYSSWWRLIWKTASWVKGFRVIFSKTGPDRVTGQDIKYAEQIWILSTQQESFSKEYRLMKAGKPLPKSSKLFECSPEVDENNLIIMAGRLKKFKSSLYLKLSPIILDGKHPYVQLLIQHLHEANAHQGFETVMNNLRKKYWILHQRSSVRMAINNCGHCKLHRAKPISPEMAPIPECRTAIGDPPFTHCGVDLFGPYEVAIGRRTEKRWGILFVCMTTRAVYIDLVPSLSSSDVIDALVRFSSRRGPPKHLYSDQGTNFKGADREIGECYKRLSSPGDQTIIMKRGLEWNFNCPAASNMGGSWERMIGLAKKILLRTMKERRPKEYSLLTFLAEAENILNSRPLTFVSTDPNDQQAITPNHLLKLRCGTSNIVPGSYEDAGKMKQMWRHAQHLADVFWKQWTDAVLPALNKRPKWHVKTPPVKVGDIVLVVDDQSERNSWKKGTIINIFPGKDGIIRVVEVKVPVVTVGESSVRFAVYKRPVNKLCILDVS